jgi:hypothetical protein
LNFVAVDAKNDRDIGVLLQRHVIYTQKYLRRESNSGELGIRIESVAAWRQVDCCSLFNTNFSLDTPMGQLLSKIFNKQAYCSLDGFILRRGF